MDRMNGYLSSCRSQKCEQINHKRKSTIPYLQRQLNRDVLKRKSEFKYFETFFETKKLRTENTKHSELVNYVSFADPIT